MTLYDLVLLAGLVLTVWRVTRLLITDTWPPVRLVREWFVLTFARTDGVGEIVGARRWGLVGYSLAYIWTCAWCMSVWVGLATWGLTDWLMAESVPLLWLVVPVGSLMAGIGTSLEAGHDQRWSLRQRELDK